MQGIVFGGFAVREFQPYLHGRQGHTVIPTVELRTYKILIDNVSGVANDDCVAVVRIINFGQCLLPVNLYPEAQFVMHVRNADVLHVRAKHI